MNHIKRTSVILAAALALSLLLTACGKNGNNPTGDNPTPGATDNTPTGDNSTPDTSSTPNGGDATTPDTSETPTDEKQYGMPTWADPSNYDAEKKANIDDAIAYTFGSDIDVDKLISEVIEEYGEYIDEHITPEAVRTATILGREEAVQNQNYKSVTGLPKSSYEKANDYLKSKGIEPFNGFEWADPSKPDEQTAKNSIAALAIAASLFYVENWKDLESVLYDFGNAFGCAYSGTDKFDEYFRLAFMNVYYVE